MINALESILQCWKRGMKSESGFSFAMASQPFEINILKSRYHKFADEKISADESRIKFHISSPIEFTNGSYIIIDLWDWGP